MRMSIGGLLGLGVERCRIGMNLLTLTLLLFITVSMCQSQSSSQCDEENGLTWNGFQCVTFPGHPCRDSVSVSVNDSDTVQVRKCVAHAYCSPQSGVCECEGGFIPSHGSQVCFLTHGSLCSDYWPCAGEIGLKCMEVSSSRSGTRTSFVPQMKCQCEEGYDWVKSKDHCTPRPTTTTQPPPRSSDRQPVIVANYHPRPLVLVVKSKDSKSSKGSRTPLSVITTITICCLLFSTLSS